MRRATLTLALTSALAPLAAAQPCTPDPGLSHAAAALLAADTRPTAADVLAAARAAGSDAPLVEAVLLPDDVPARRAHAIERRARRFLAPLACGEARSEGRLLLLIAPRAGHLDLTEAGDVVPRLAHGWRDPRLYARDAEGTIWQSAARHGEPTRFASDLVPPITLQLVADGPGGPRPVAERVIGVAVIPSHVPRSDEPLEHRLDRLRASSSASPLRRNRRLAEVATRHAEDVCARRTAVHVTDDGDPERRLARAGLRARHVGETVARAADASHAYAAILRSPSHRSALVDRRFTDVGVGEARDGDRTCLVVLLAAWPRPLPWSERR